MKYCNCVSVYRHAGYGDCTNGGVSSRHDNFTVFWDCDVDTAIKYCEDNKINIDEALLIVDRILWGEEHPYAMPLIHPTYIGKDHKEHHKIGPMFGGNFLYTYNGNFYHPKCISTGIPIPIHDRFETQEEYDTLSV